MAPELEVLVPEGDVRIEFAAPVSVTEVNASCKFQPGRAYRRNELH
jgi:hypothetical protein